MTEEQLAALLRLKRFEQPPPEYFEKLLQDVHRRQRAELLNRPLWRIAWERIQTFFGEHSMGGLSYAGAMSAMLLVGMTTIGLLTPTRGGRPSHAAGLSASAQRATPPPHFSLQASTTTALPLETQPFPPAPGRHDTSRFPRFVIDARPASYEPVFQF
jgi:hypothetical protein